MMMNSSHSSNNDNNESYDYISSNDKDNDNNSNDNINYDNTLLAVNVIHMDYAMIKSNKVYEFVECLDSPLPVIRIFGSSWSGQKVCVHVHGALPYFYFRPDNIDDTTFDQPEEVKTYIPNMKNALEEILNASYPNGYSKRIHIHKLEVVMKRPLYGYFPYDIPFIKITLRSPNYMRKVINILEDDGKALGIRMQSYDAHFPYLLKFTVDYNLVPMGWLFIRNGKFRKPLPVEGFNFHPPEEKSENAEDVTFKDNNNDINDTISKNTNVSNNSNSSKAKYSPTVFTQLTVPHANIWSDDDNDAIADMSSQDFRLLFQTQLDQIEKTAENNGNNNKEAILDFGFKKVSSCDLEIDIHVNDIINASLPRKKFGEDLWDEEKARRKRKGLSQEKVLTPPSTNTNSRAKGLVEQEFEKRVSSLLLKGKVRNEERFGSQPSPSNINFMDHDSDFYSWALEASQLEFEKLEADKALREILRDTSSAARNYLENTANSNVNNFELISELLFEIVADLLNEIVPSDDHDEDEDEESKTETENILKFSESQKYENDVEDDVNDNNITYDDNRMVIDDAVDINNLNSNDAVKSHIESDGIILRQPVRGVRHVFSQPKRKYGNISNSAVSNNNNEILSPTGPNSFNPYNFEISPIKAPYDNSYMSSDNSNKSSPYAESMIEKSIETTTRGTFILKPAIEGTILHPPRKMQLRELESYGISNHVNDPLRDTSAKAPRHNAMVRRHPVVYGNKLEPFDGGFPTASTKNVQGGHILPKKRCMLPTFLPPAPKVIRQEANQPEFEKKLKPRIRNDRSQIQTPTPTNDIDSMRLAMSIGTETKSESLRSRLTMMSLEVHSSTNDVTRLSFLPDPKDAPVRLISWHVEDNMSDAETECVQRISGIICMVNVTLGGNFEKEAFKEKKLIMGSGIPLDTKINIVRNEEELFRELISIVRIKDPDILMGYEIQRNSIGYIIARAKFLGIDLSQELSKVPGEKPVPSTEWAEDTESGIFITGRITLNLWRRMKSELKLMSYTYQNVASHLLSRKVPEFTQEQLTLWYRNPVTRGNTIRHIHTLALLNFHFVDKLDLIRRTSESSRLYGIDFFSVLTRGSQYRVEASLLRNAFKSNFVAISPSKRKVAGQAAMAVIPLVLEPISRFYEDPVLVLDFQSLYPSMIIAYNLCYSTIMGKLNPGTGNPDTTERLGVISYPEKMSSSGVFKLEDDGLQPFIAPNGSMFCPKEFRQGLLPSMLKDILETRLMIKRAMKVHNDPSSRLLLRSLDARQLAIKLLSNVTYGYTSAGFSGRMPMAELADAIVQCGRSTLEDAISVIRSNQKWKAEVVYGDTDSIFVLLKNRSKAEAFKIGEEIVNVITARNPKDVVLKFEKVYYPCILVSKKRYVGNAYESVHQAEAHFDAKGIEVVRRDQCPATAKMQEKALRILFNTRDLAQVRKYLQMQWKKIHQGTNKVLVSDFVFCKEVRMDTYRGNPPPAAVVASLARHKDPMAEPPYKWRVPYVKVCGQGRLMDLVTSPHNLLLRGSDLVLDINYYIVKCINPALERVFGMCESTGVIERWYKNSPKPKPFRRHIAYEDYSKVNKEDNHVHRANNSMILKQQTITSFVKKGTCEICSASPSDIICNNCKEDQAKSLSILTNTLNNLYLTDYSYKKICENCTRQTQFSVLFKKSELIGPECCCSIDCAVFFQRLRTVTRIEDASLALESLTNDNDNLDW